jgi:hypothetical protein
MIVRECCITSNVEQTCSKCGGSIPPKKVFVQKIFGKIIDDNVFMPENHCYICIDCYPSKHVVLEHNEYKT